MSCRKIVKKTEPELKKKLMLPEAKFRTADEELYEMARSASAFRPFGGAERNP